VRVYKKFYYDWNYYRCDKLRRDPWQFEYTVLIVENCNKLLLGHHWQFRCNALQFWNCQLYRDGKCWLRVEKTEWGCFLSSRRIKIQIGCGNKIWWNASEREKKTLKSIKADIGSVELVPEKHAKCTNCMEFIICHRSIGFYTARPESHLYFSYQRNCKKSN